MALSASSPRRIASSLSKSVMPSPLPVSRLTSIIIFAPSSPGGVSPETSPRTSSIASSTWAGSLSNVAMRAYMTSPLVDSDQGEVTPMQAPTCAPGPRLCDRPTVHVRDGDDPGMASDLQSPLEGWNEAYAAAPERDASFTTLSG